MVSQTLLNSHSPTQSMDESLRANHVETLALTHYRGESPKCRSAELGSQESRPEVLGWGIKLAKRAKKTVGVVGAHF